MSSDKILLVGCGKMGGALLDGFLSNGIAQSNVTVVEPNSADLEKYENLQLFGNLPDIPKNTVFDIIVFAVKPQMMTDVAKQCVSFIGVDTVCISVAAGKTLKFFSNILGADKAIIRSMPNLPALIGKGATVAVAGDNVTDAQKQKAEKLLSSVGSLFFIEDEELMDAVTAISGSGPAYVFYFLECFVKAAKEVGLSDELAKDLAYATLNGSTLLAMGSEDSADVLRKKVTSPNGTTEAALNVLMKDEMLENLLKDSADAAKERSCELAD